jgi:Uncharacterised nucleotidyltransferase
VNRAPVWFPSRDGELLLRAALLEGEQSSVAWAGWRAAHIDEQFDLASFRLLPLVYKNLVEAGSDDPYLHRLKGMYRRSWFLTQSLLTGAAGTVELLEGAGIPTMLLKGAGLAVAHYRDLGVRPMDDVDVAVPRERAADALTVLGEAGLAPRRAVEKRDLRTGHAELLVSEEGTAIDLHWSILWQAGDDAELWRDSVPVQLHGVATRTLSPADQILHVCAHATYSGQIHPLRWVADARAVERSSAVDWQRLARIARERELGSPLADALAYLRDRFGMKLPADLPARLRDARVRPLRRAAQRVCASPPSPMRSSGLPLLYLDVYLSQVRAAGSRPSPRGFLRWLQRHLKVESGRELASLVRRSFARRASEGAVMAPRR